MAEVGQGQGQGQVAASSVSQKRKRPRPPRGSSCEEGDGSSNDELFATVQYSLDFPSDNPQGVDASGSGPGLGHGPGLGLGQGPGQGPGLAASIHGLGFFNRALPTRSSPSGIPTAAPVAMGFNNGSTKVASAIESLISDRAQNGHGHGLVLGSQRGVD